MSRLNQPRLGTRLLIHIIVYAGGLTMVLPFAWMVITSLKTSNDVLQSSAILPAGAPTQWEWGNYRQAWESAQLGRFYLNSAVVAIAVTVLSVLYNALAGFAFAKLRFAGRRITFGIVLATMMLPYQVYFIFAYILCDRLGYLDSYQGLIVPFLASAFGIFYLRQAISSVPDSVLDAGRVDGLTNFELFWHLVVPTVRPALGALAIFTFMAHWNSFFWPLIVIDSSTYNTLPLAVAALSYGLYADSWPVQMAAASIITLPMILVFLIFQRQFVSGVALTGMKE